MKRVIALTLSLLVFVSVAFSGVVGATSLDPSWWVKRSSIIYALSYVSNRGKTNIYVFTYRYVYNGETYDNMGVRFEEGDYIHLESVAGSKNITRGEKLTGISNVSLSYLGDGTGWYFRFNYNYGALFSCATSGPVSGVAPEGINTVPSENHFSFGHLLMNVFLTLFGIPVSDTYTTAFDGWLNSHYGYDIDYLLFNKLASAELVELPIFTGGGGETRGGGVGRRWDCTKEEFVEAVSMMSTVVGSSFDSNSDIIQEAINVMEQDIAAGKEDSFVWNIPVDSSGNVVQGLPPLMYLPERVGVVVNSPDYVPVTSGNYDHTYNGTMATNPNWPNTIAFPPSTSSEPTSSETSSSGDYVVSSDAVTSSMVDSGHVDIGTIEGFESDIFGGISDSGVDPGDFSFSSGFVRALDFIAKTWTRCFNGLGDFKAVITFPLYLGVALFILGRLSLLMPSDRRRSGKKPKDKGGG